jgi:hypothetical protein
VTRSQAVQVAIGVTGRPAQRAGGGAGQPESAPSWKDSLELSAALFTALNKASQAHYHEIVSLEPAEAAALSDKAVAIIRAAEAGVRAAAHGGAPGFLSPPEMRLGKALLGGRRCRGGGAIIDLNEVAPASSPPR